MLFAYHPSGALVHRGEYIVSRTGERARFVSCVEANTAAHFGKIVVTKGLCEKFSIDTAPKVTYTDFAWNLTVRWA